MNSIPYEVLSYQAPTLTTLCLFIPASKLKSHKINTLITTTTSATTRITTTTSSSATAATSMRFASEKLQRTSAGLEPTTVASAGRLACVLATQRQPKTSHHL
jgi:hypothetical protein